MTISERIEYAKKRIAFWEGYKEQQVWIGIKVELELIKGGN